MLPRFYRPNYDGTSGCRFEWKIESISLSWWMTPGQVLKSGKFTADGVGSTTWSLGLCPMGDSTDVFNISLFVQRDEDCSGPEAIEVNCTLGIVDGEDVNRIEGKSDFFRKGEVLYFRNQGMDLRTLFFTEREWFIPEDTLTVVCTLGKAKEKNPEISKYIYGRTVFKLNRKTFDWRIDGYSTLRSAVRKKFKDDLVEFDFVLATTVYDYLLIDIISFDNRIKCISSKVSFTDSKGVKEIFVINKLSGCELKKGMSSKMTFPTYIMDNKSHYLPNDVLILDFDVVVSTLEYFDGTKDSVKALESIDKGNTSYARQEKYEPIAALIEDFKSMHNDRILSDTELRTSTQSFPAHQNVLSARSPVFRRMFGHDMKEKNCGHVDIEDLEDDTVHRMLQFIYTGFLEGLEFKSASSLYAAADKYEIHSLKIGCSSFLKDNLTPETACDVLLLADLHQDEDLKNVVQAYVLEHDEVFQSKEWKGFMDNHVKLAAGIMYLKIHYGKKS